MTDNNYGKAVLNLLTALAVVLAAVFLLPKVLVFFLPFVIGGIISMIANPLVRFLDERLKIHRKAGSAIVIVSVIALILLAAYFGLSFLLREGVGFVRELPELWQSMQDSVSRAAALLQNVFQNLPVRTDGGSSQDFAAAFGNMLTRLANSLGSPTIDAVGNLVGNLPSIFVGVIMCLLSAYFFVAQREEIWRFFQNHVPEGSQSRWYLMYKSLTGAVGGYFKAQFKIEIWMYLLLLAGFLLLKVRYAAVIALGIALLDILPVFGTGVVLIPWAIVSLLGGDYKMAIGLLVLWGAGQLIRQLIQPKIVGDSVGLSPLPTLFLLYIGYRIGSIGGMILSVPIGIILLKMYQAGFFDTTLESLRILLRGFNRFRKLTPKEEEKNGSLYH